MLGFAISSSVIAKVLPVNLEAEVQEDFILHNIDMPDLPGLSEEAVKDVEIFQSDCFVKNSIKIKSDLKNNAHLFMVSAAKIIVGIVSQQQFEEHKMSGMNLQAYLP